MTKSFRETLFGAWKLVEYTMEDDNGEKFYPLGKDAKGFILYTPDGYMSAQIMESGRPIYSSGDLFTGTTEEMAKAAHGYLAYSGRYEVDEATHTLVHHMDVSLNPTWLGQDQERYVKLDGDTIVITTSVDTAMLAWKRAEGQSNQ
jgi:hypothetical protein